MIFSLEPVFASLTAVFVLNEHLPAAGSTGAIMILTGILFAEVPLTKTFKVPDKELIKIKTGRTEKGRQEMGEREKQKAIRQFFPREEREGR